MCCLHWGLGVRVLKGRGLGSKGLGLRVLGSWMIRVFAAMGRVQLLSEGFIGIRELHDSRVSP